MYYDDDSEERPLKASDRKKRAELLVQQLLARGEEITPVLCSKKKDIASSFWGKKWCHYVHHFADMSDRLSHGRSLLRNSSVLHLEVLPTSLRGKVFDQEIYNVEVRYNKIPYDSLQKLQEQIRFSVSDRLSLLSGEIPDGLILALCENEHFFPGVQDIRFSCNCLDYAGLCGHAAALCYALGILLDTNPELLFTLRQIPVAEIFSSSRQNEFLDFPAEKETDKQDLEDLFGISLL